MFALRRPLNYVWEVDTDVYYKYAYLEPRQIAHTSRLVCCSLLHLGECAHKVHHRMKSSVLGKRIDGGWDYFRQLDGIVMKGKAYCGGGDSLSSSFAFTC